MKKLFIFLMMGCIAFLSSCKSEIGLTYNISVAGEGDGAVSVQFPQGVFEMDGAAEINFYAHDTIPFTQATYLTKQQVVESGNKQYVAALDLVQAELAKVAAIDTAGGSYDFLIDGEVLIYPFNVAVKVHKRLSNRENEINRAARVNELYDRWCFIE